MANSGRDTNGSQFCEFFSSISNEYKINYKLFKKVITLAKTHWLSGHYVAFGRVLHGMEIVKKIGWEGSKSGLVKKNVVIADCGEIKHERK